MRAPRVALSTNPRSHQNCVSDPNPIFGALNLSGQGRGRGCHFRVKLMPEKGYVWSGVKVYPCRVTCRALPQTGEFTEAFLPTS